MINTDRLTQLGKEYLLAKEKYERAVRINIRTVKLQKDFQKTTFWDMLQDLGDTVLRNVRKRDDPVRYGIQEWLREICVKGKDGYDFDDVPAFVRVYNKLKESLAKKLRGVIEPGGGFSDIVDALPLTGKEACLRILNGEARDAEQLREIARWGTADGSSSYYFAEHIFHKENHVEQWLEQAYADKLCETLAFKEGDFALELENADP